MFQLKACCKNSSNISQHTKNAKILKNEHTSCTKMNSATIAQNHKESM